MINIKHIAWRINYFIFDYIKGFIFLLGIMFSIILLLFIFNKNVDIFITQSIIQASQNAVEKVDVSRDVYNHICVKNKNILTNEEENDLCPKWKQNLDQIDLFEKKLQEYTKYNTDKHMQIEIDALQKEFNALKEAKNKSDKK